MANKTWGLSTVGAVAVRATRLNCDGTVVGEGDDNDVVAGYATCKFTEISLTPVVLEGDTIQQRTAGGVLCINVERDDEVTGYTLEIEQCDVDAEFAEIIGAAPAIVTDGSGDTIGAELAAGVLACSCSGGVAGCNNIVFEFWLPAYNCGAENGYVRYIIPSVRFSEGNNTKTFGNAANLTRFTGNARPNENIDAAGPWADLPAGVSLSGNPLYFWEATLPAGLDTDTGGYISKVAS